MKPVSRFTLGLLLLAAVVPVAPSRAGDDGPRVNPTLFPATSPKANPKAFRARAQATYENDPLPVPEPPVNNQPVPVVFNATTLSLGSLWKEGVTNEAGMFADRRARRRGDTVTIVVNEDVNLVNNIQFQTTKQNAVTGLIDKFVLSLPSTKYLKGDKDGTTGGGLLAGTNDYKSGSQLNNRQTLTARAAVTVIDTLPNGNLVIEGARIVSFSGETKYAHLRGIVRADDVLADNTVLSTNVADAQVEFLAEGALTDAQKKGWLSRLYDRVNPF